MTSTAYNWPNQSIVPYIGGLFVPIRLAKYIFLGCKSYYCPTRKVHPVFPPLPFAVRE